MTPPTYYTDENGCLVDEQGNVVVIDEGSPPKQTPLEQLVEKVAVPQLFQGGMTPDMRALMAYAEEQHKQKTINASKVRKSVTKADLETHKAAFMAKAKKQGSDYGWTKAACLHFGITKDTIRKRMGD